MLIGTQQLAAMLGAERWQIQRIIERGEIPQPPKIGGRWVFDGEVVPLVVDALRTHGWLPESGGRAR